MAESEPDSSHHQQCYKNQLLYLLHTNKSLDVTSLIGKQDEGLKEYYVTIKSLQKDGLVNYDPKTGKVEITADGEKKLPPQVKEQVDAPFDYSCKKCEARGIVSTPTSNNEQMNKLCELLKDRPAASEEYDQWYMHPLHATYRTNQMYNRGDVLDKEILLIGDDDLLGIAIALTKLPKRVVVLEIDERIVDFVNKLAKEHNLPMEGHKFDIRFPLPDQFRGKFDVFCCDPIETVEGVNLFLSRGFSALKGVGCSAYFGLTTLEASKKKWFQIQKLISQMNFAVTDILRNFTEYPDPGWEEKLTIWKSFETKPTQTWYKSAFYRVEAIDTINPIITDEHGLTDDIYQDPETWATTENKFEVEC